MGDRVVAFSDGPEVAVHGTVRWSENSNIGIETVGWIRFVAS